MITLPEPVNGQSFVKIDVTTADAVVEVTPLILASNSGARLSNFQIMPNPEGRGVKAFSLFLVFDVAPLCALAAQTHK